MNLLHRPTLIRHHSIIPIHVSTKKYKEVTFSLWCFYQIWLTLSSSHYHRTQNMSWAMSNEKSNDPFQLRTENPLYFLNWQNVNFKKVLNFHQFLLKKRTFLRIFASFLLKSAHFSRFFTTFFSPILPKPHNPNPHWNTLCGLLIFNQICR